METARKILFIAGACSCCHRPLAMVNPLSAGEGETETRKALEAARAGEPRWGAFWYGSDPNKGANIWTLDRYGRRSDLILNVGPDTDRLILARAICVLHNQKRDLAAIDAALVSEDVQGWRTDESTFLLEWIGAARPPVHPEPMRGRQSFCSFDEAVSFMAKQPPDAVFVSLVEQKTAKLDRTAETLLSLAAPPAPPAPETRT